MIIRTVLTVSRCGIQMSLQIPSLVLLFPNTERQIQFKKKSLQKCRNFLKQSILIQAVHSLCNLFGLFYALGVGIF